MAFFYDTQRSGKVKKKKKDTHGLTSLSVISLVTRWTV